MQNGNMKRMHCHMSRSMRNQTPGIVQKIGMHTRTETRQNIHSPGSSVYTSSASGKKSYSIHGAMISKFNFGQTDSPGRYTPRYIADFPQSSMVKFYNRSKEKEKYQGLDTETLVPHCLVPISP